MSTKDDFGYDDISDDKDKKSGDSFQSKIKEDPRYNPSTGQFNPLNSQTVTKDRSEAFGKAYRFPISTGIGCRSRRLRKSRANKRNNRKKGKTRDRGQDVKFISLTK
jgi:hypothetical protein